MGYTHHWYRKKELPQDLWDKFISDVNYFVTGSNEILVRERYSDQPPTVNEDEVRFNGKGDDGHEDFWIHRVMPKSALPVRPGSYFAFCKTEHKPYDEAVVATLSLAELCFGKLIEISSDGGWETVKLRYEYADKKDQ
jgi:hypothetical protein